MPAKNGTNDAQFLSFRKKAAMPLDSDRRYKTRLCNVAGFDAVQSGVVTVVSSHPAYLRVRNE
jgi:hypothetical protein